MNEFEQHMEDNDGYCTTCKAWDDDFYEPDVHEARCPACGKDTMYGAEKCAVMGLMDAMFPEGEDDR